MRKRPPEGNAAGVNGLHGPSQRALAPQAVKGWRGLFVAPDGEIRAASLLRFDLGEIAKRMECQSLQASSFTWKCAVIDVYCKCKVGSDIVSVGVNARGSRITALW